MTNIPDRQKGSTLVMTIYIMALISMLGMTIFTLGFINYRMKTIDGDVKKAYYLAEGGIEAARAFIQSEIFNAAEHGHIHEDFKESYKTYLNGDIYGSSLVDKIAEHDFPILLEEGEEQRKPLVQVVEYDKFNENNPVFHVVLESTYTYGKVTKKIKANFEIDVPENESGELSEVLHMAYGYIE